MMDARMMDASGNKRPPLAPLEAGVPKKHHTGSSCSVQDAAEEEDDESCNVCGISTWIEGNELLLCDGEGCDRAYHMPQRWLPPARPSALLRV